MLRQRRWLPYGRIESQHLGLALATARVLAWIGMLLIAGGAVYGAVATVSRSGFAATAGVMVAGTVIGLIGYGLAALVVSGALAGLVGIEDALRRREPGEPPAK